MTVKKKTASALTQLFKGRMSEILISNISIQNSTNGVEGCTAGDLVKLVAPKFGISAVDYPVLKNLFGARLSQLRSHGKVNALTKRRGREVVYYINRPISTMETQEVRKARREAVEAAEDSIIHSIKVSIQHLDDVELVALSQYTNELIAERLHTKAQKLEQAAAMLKGIEHDLNNT